VLQVVFAIADRDGLSREPRGQGLPTAARSARRLAWHGNQPQRQA
jgi:hypothetical protein